MRVAGAVRISTGRRQPSAIATIALHEFRAGLRRKMIPAFGVLFAALTLGITLAGLGASGQLLVQGFMRTAVSLLTLAVYLLPLIGLILGASAFGGEDGGAELLLAQPIKRSNALLGRSLGLTLCLVTISLAGFGSAGIVVLSANGGAGFGLYALVAVATTILGIAALHAGVLIGTLVRSRTTAVAWALAAWFAGAVVYDLATILLLQTVGSGHPSPLLIALLALNPLDGVRVLGLISLGAEVLLGPAGAAVQKLMSGREWIIMWGSLATWLLVPLLIATNRYCKRDF